MLICMLLQFVLAKKARSNYKQGGIAKGCGNVMEERRKVTKKY
jgi:hypothetical protein